MDSDRTRNTWNLIQNHWVIIQQAYYAMKLPSHPDILKKRNTSNLSLESSNHTSKTFKQLPTHSFTNSPKHPVRGKASQKDTSEFLSRTFPWKVPMTPMIPKKRLVSRGAMSLTRTASGSTQLLGGRRESLPLATASEHGDGFGETEKMGVSWWLP